MKQFLQSSIGVGVALIGTALSDLSAFAQGNLPVATAGDQVVIKREACRIVEPQKYRVPLSIEASQTVTLVAPFDGTVKQLGGKPNSKVQSQGEVVRLDNTIQKLNLSRAQLVAKLAAIEMKQAEKDETLKELAQVKIDMAKIDVELAQAAVDHTSIRMPFAGEIQRIMVTEGQFVRAGEPVAVVADNRMMKVEIPVDRSAAETGKLFAFKIEQDEVEGKIDAVLPLPPKFEPLRDLFDSIASVLVIIDNPHGKYKVGQTVYVPLIPRQPVVEVANSAVGNLTDGHRKVQVVRQSFVRDIPVTVMGQVGTTRVFVSGPFAEGDEVIYESSHLLGDAFQLKPSGGKDQTTTGQPGTTPPPAGSKPAF